MTFRQTEEYLLSLELFGMRFGLDRMHRLMTVLGLPQRRFASIHVVGTNGKSSTVRFCAAILERHGLRTGSYTSPHLGSFRERIEVGEEAVSEADFAAAVTRAAEAAEMVNRPADPDDRVTQFEALTAAAYHELGRRGVEVAVIEAGLGGRFDATNVVPSKVQVLTSVGLEHTRWLGPTVTDIAQEKLAVVRDHGTLVTGELDAESLAVAKRVTRERQAELVSVGVGAAQYEGFGPGDGERSAPGDRERSADGDRERSAPGDRERSAHDDRERSAPGDRERFAHDDGERSAPRDRERSAPRDRSAPGDGGRFAPADLGLALRASGRFQRGNFAIAAAAAEAFLGRPLDLPALEAAAAETTIPGRVEVVALDPLTVYDGAHNPAGARALAESLDDVLGERRPRVAVIGVLEDKDAAGMLRELLPRLDRVVYTRSQNPRSLSPGTLATLAEKLDGPASETVADPRAAVDRARALAGRSGAVLATGSIYLVADLVREDAASRASML